MTERTNRTGWISNVLFLVMMVAVAYVMYGLIQENRMLKARLAELQTSPAADGLAAGSPLPDVALLAADGRRESTLATLLPEGGVIAFLTTTCPYCEQTLPTWSQLAARYEARGVPFLGVAFDEPTATDAYARAHGLQWPLWVPAPGSAGLAEISRVPYTVLVGGDGTVLETWLGVLPASGADRILTALDEELEGAGSLLSGSSVRDPGDSPVPVPGTGTGR